MREVWPVSHGAYSDYEVVAVCETKEIAEALAATLNADKSYGDDYQVDFPLDCYGSDDPMPATVTTWRAVINNDGELTVTSRTQWPHEVNQGGGKSYYGAQAYGYPTPEEAERAARAWAK